MIAGRRSVPGGVRGDRGSAVVEFTVFAIVAIVPLAWVALALQQLVAVHHAVQTAAGESLRAYLTASSQPAGQQRADVAAGLILSEHPAVMDYQVSVTCDSPRCLSPGATVRVTVAAHTELPQIPVLGLVPTLDSTAEQYGVVDAYLAPR
jgi:hypothetical protein